MLKTRITELLGIDYPIMSAPMAMHSSGRLAAAVSDAGAFGLFGGSNLGGAQWLRSEIHTAREMTGRPFGVGFLTHLVPLVPAVIDVVIEEKVPVVAFSFADPAPYTDRLKSAGATIICQVQSMKAAGEAVAAGAHVLVAQGNEAGGHSGAMNLLPLLVNVLEAYPEIPVLAAGGISSGRALAAVLAAGADGALVGTAFLATSECADVPDAYKQAIVEGDGEDTVQTSVMDIIMTNALGIPPWPDGISERLRWEPLVEKWHGREDQLRESLPQAIQEFQESRSRGELSVLMGQAAGSITSIRPVAEVVRSICDDAEGRLRSAGVLADAAD